MSPETGSKSFTQTFAGSMTKRVVAPVAATAAAASSTYVARKWHDTIAPALEARGGPRAALADALETAAEKLPESLSPAIRDLARYVSGDASQGQARAEKSEPVESAANGDREAQREERKKRRQARQRALQRSGTS
jgi:hypothetical protein